MATAGSSMSGAMPQRDTGQHSRGHSKSSRRSLRTARDSAEDLLKRRDSAAKSSQNRKSGTRDSQGSRSGQHFRVGNIAGNGLIYMRPVARTNQQQSNTSPVTPPNDELSPNEQVWQDWRDSALSSASTVQSTPPPEGEFQSRLPATLPRPPTPVSPYNKVKRSAARPDESEPLPNQRVNTVAVVIDRASTHQRTKSEPAAREQESSIHISDQRSNPAHTSAGISTIPHNIPQTARFGEGDTISNGASSNERVRSNSATRKRPSIPRSVSQRSVSTRPHSFGHVQRKVASSDMLSAQHRNAAEALNPEKFLRSDPGKEALFNLMPASGKYLLVGTPSQIIARITSANSLDYELLSDFFLTYRSFITPKDLASQLIQRLRSAIHSSEYNGRIVRVRTFVALRHWILNYFIDDFVNDLDLRKHLCALVNSLCDELRKDHDETGGNLKILGELKKCWRRTCAMIWHTQGTLFVESAEKDITPGGTPTETEPIVSASFPTKHEYSPESTLWLRPTDSKSSMSAQGNLHGAQDFNIPYSTNRTAHLKPIVTQQTTTKSMQGFAERNGNNGSFTMLPLQTPNKTWSKSKSKPKQIITTGLGLGSPLSGGPRSPLRSPMQSPGTGSTSLQNMHKRNRSASFSDALRDDRLPLASPKKPIMAETVDASTIIPGSLIKGALLRPGTSYVDEIAPNSPINDDAHFNFDINMPETANGEPNGVKAISNPGVRRFFGSMRRAWTTRQGQTQYPTGYVQGQNLRADDIGTNMMSTPSRSGHNAPKRKLLGGQTLPRVDLLCLEVTEAFTRALQDVEMRERQLFQQETPVLHADYQHTVVGNSSYGQGSGLSPKMMEMRDESGPRVPYPIQTSSAEQPMQNFKPSTLTSNNQKLQNLQTAPQSDQQHGFTTSQRHNEYQQHVPGPTQSLSAIHSRSKEDQTQQMHPPATRTMTNSVEQSRVEHYETNNRHVLEQNGLQNRSIARAGSGNNHTMATEHFLSEDRVPNNLRRRPGGNDLRAVDNVHDLNGNSVHRQSSFDSANLSVLIAPPTDLYNFQPNKVGEAHQDIKPQPAPAIKNGRKTSPRLYRPSMEVAAAQLAGFPDMEEQGDVETALAKLEGRAPESPLANVFSNIDPSPQKRIIRRNNLQPGVYSTELIRPQFIHNDDGKFRGIQKDVGATHTGAAENSTVHATRRPDTQTIAQLRDRMFVNSQAISLTDSNASDSSVPLFERGTSNPPPAKQSPLTPNWPLPKVPATQPQPSTFFDMGRNGFDRNPQAIEPLGAADETDSIARASSAHESFLLDDDQTLSGLSTNQHDDSSITRPHFVTQSSFFDDNSPITPQPPLDHFFDNQPDLTERTRPLSPHTMDSKQEQPSLSHEPSSTLHDASEELSTSPPLGLPPHSYIFDGPNGISNGKAHTGETEWNRYSAHPQLRTDMDAQEAATHLPFILSYDSLLIAQQLALIEKDALCGIEWRDLINLRWNPYFVPIRTWVDYLNPYYRTPSLRGSYPQWKRPSTTQPASTLDDIRTSGVDLCIARFNLVSRWTLSEVVLTQDINERAATVTKFIHIALHSRRLRNWASMYQITMALVRNDCSRLKQTWSLVPEYEKVLLRELEDLILPRRNFFNLRKEMDIATAAADGAAGIASAAGDDMNRGTDSGGCIPFIGIYTHDLIYNARKPAFVDVFVRDDHDGDRVGQNSTARQQQENPMPGHQPREQLQRLVNFDRHHNAAVIVKNLLRLIESSTRYNFPIVPEVAARCLWLGALDEAEISRRSKELEMYANTLEKPHIV